MLTSGTAPRPSRERTNYSTNSPSLPRRTSPLTSTPTPDAHPQVQGKRHGKPPTKDDRRDHPQQKTPKKSRGVQSLQ
ncbi:hypothetical protein L13192_06074 [Pyrenophora tritici-repentis]|nr:hypothetical protein L13192_06074 [Pyrenophora tritici-repentis]